MKNRRKNGDFYWVMANVTPLMEGDRPSGYMSVRTEATREQTDAAERLYATMRAERTQGARSTCCAPAIWCATTCADALPAR